MEVWETAQKQLEAERKRIGDDTKFADWIIYVVGILNKNLYDALEMNRKLRDKKQEESKKLDRNCPVCHEPPEITCKCPLSDSQCKNGHDWHYCLVHDKVVLGKSDHSKDTMSCHCFDEKYEP